MRINKTIYIEPYGTKIIYHYKDDIKYSEKPVKINSKTRTKHLSKYDIEQFAKECNAYIVREERREQQEQILNGKNNSE